MTARIRPLKVTTVARRVAALHLADREVEWGEPAGIAIVTLPAWVKSAGLAASDGMHWLWVEPAAGAVPDGGPSQAVLDAPRGRYRIDAIDPASGAVVAREIATAAPLVIGLPRRGGAVVLRIEPVRARP